MYHDEARSVVVQFTLVQQLRKIEPLWSVNNQPSGSDEPGRCFAIGRRRFYLYTPLFARPGLMVLPFCVRCQPCRWQNVECIKIWLDQKVCRARPRPLSVAHASRNCLAALVERLRKSAPKGKVDWSAEALHPLYKEVQACDLTVLLRETYLYPVTKPTTFFCYTHPVNVHLLLSHTSMEHYIPKRGQAQPSRPCVLLGIWQERAVVVGGRYNPDLRAVPPPFPRLDAQYMHACMPKPTTGLPKAIALSTDCYGNAMMSQKLGG
ncbi:hypothetical protein KCU74_g38, partial [Aureobasidium melanogenum]